jgi:hypothetical protein
MKNFILFFALIFVEATLAQNFKITYMKSSNGTLIENQDARLVFTNTYQTLLSNENSFSSWNVSGVLIGE